MEDREGKADREWSIHMASHSIADRSHISEIRLSFLIALLGPTLLTSGSSSAQQTAPETAPPAVTTDSFNAKLRAIRQDIPSRSPSRSARSNQYSRPARLDTFKRFFTNSSRRRCRLRFFSKAASPRSYRNTRSILTLAAEPPRTNRSARRRLQAMLSFRAWATTAVPASPAISRPTR